MSPRPRRALRGPIAKERPAPVARTVTRCDAAGTELGEVDLEPSIFGIEPNLAVLHQVVTAQLAGGPLGHPVDEDPGRGARRRGQALPPEGHRASPAGIDPVPAVGRRRRRPRPEAPLLPPADPEEDGPARPALGALDRAADGRVVLVDRWALESPSTKEAVAALEALGPRRPGARGAAAGDDGSRRPLVRATSQRSRHRAGRRAQRLRRPPVNDWVVVHRRHAVPRVGEPEAEAELRPSPTGEAAEDGTRRMP